MAKDEIARLSIDKESSPKWSHATCTDQQVETNTHQDDDHDKTVALNDRLIKELKSLKEVAKLEQSRHSEELAVLKRELLATNQKASLLREELTKCERREEERVEEIKYLQTELEMTQKSNESMEATIKEPYEEMIKTIREECDANITSLTERKQEIEQLQVKITEYERTISELQSAIKRLTNDLTDFKGHANTDHSREMESLKRTNEAAMKELCKAQEEVSTLKRSIINQEYARNVFIAYLTNPAQRPHMQQVLSRLLQLTDEETARL